MRHHDLDPELWQHVVTHLDQGVVLLSAEKLIIYANASAAALLGMAVEDLLGLDSEDFIALSQPGRLDSARLAEALEDDHLGGQAEQSLAIVTAERRLSVRVTLLETARGRFTLLLLDEMKTWRDALIAQSVIDEMHGPLSVAASYNEMLLSRLSEGSVPTYEIQSMAQIARESVERALELWESISELVETAPDGTPWKPEATRIRDVLQRAVRAVQQQPGGQQPLAGLVLELADDLPLVSAHPSTLHTALVVLIGGMLAKLKARERLIISAEDHEHYVQVTLRTDSALFSFPGYLFDTLPFAIVEQVIQRHKGRIWLASESERPAVITFALPTWTG